MVLGARFKMDSCLTSITDSKIASIVKKRSGKRRSLTKTLNTLESKELINNSDIEFYVDKLVKLKNDLIEYDAVIEEYVLEQNIWDTDTCDIQNERCEDYQDKLGLKLSFLKSKLVNSNVNHGQRHDQVTNESNSSNERKSLPKIKLPQVELPSFNGRPETYERFIDNLEKLLNKYELTQFEKYSYLLNQVSGPARQIVQSVPDSDYNYDTAKELLTEAFSDKTLQQYSVIDRLLKLKLNSVSDMYSWVSEVRMLNDQIERLNINSSIFTQYFLWSGMSVSFKQQFMLTNGTSKPNLKEITDSAFQVFDRIKQGSIHMTKSYVDSSSSNESNVMATKVQYSNSKSLKLDYKSCWFCENAGHSDFSDHKVQSCSKFPSPDSKLTVIGEVGGCVRCGLLNHEKSRCKFKFLNRCGHCNDLHAQFLCKSENKSNNSSQKVQEKNKDFKFRNKKSNNSSSKNENSSTNVVEFNVMQTDCDNSIIIPTFTFNLARKAGKNEIKARAMYDPASQISFISESLVNKVSCKNIKSNINLKITGFNSSQMYTSRTVEISTIINDRIRKFNAFVVPEIKTKVKNYSNIKAEFDRQCIPLADKMLGDQNDSGTIDILLGVDSAYVLPVHSASFGTTSNLSLLYYTGLGVMLAGRVSTLETNLPHLSYFKDYMSRVDSLI